MEESVKRFRLYETITIGRLPPIFFSFVMKKMDSLCVLASCWLVPFGVNVVCHSYLD